MGLHSISVSLFIEGQASSINTIADEIYSKLNNADIKVAHSNGRLEAARLELLYIPVDVNEEIFNSDLKEGLNKVTKVLSRLNNEYLNNARNRAKSISLLIGGWTDDGNQIDNLILPSDLLGELSRLSLDIEFLINDYHR